MWKIQVMSNGGLPYDYFSGLAWGIFTPSGVCLLGVLKSDIEFGTVIFNHFTGLWNDYEADLYPDWQYKLWTLIKRGVHAN